MKPLGKHCGTCMGSTGEILDIDFVSTTFLCSNVHGVRHNYFHLNRFLPSTKHLFVYLRQPYNA